MNMTCILTILCIVWLLSDVMFWNFVSALDAGIHVIIPKFPAHLFKLVSHSRQLVLRTMRSMCITAHQTSFQKTG